jgi:hypothetical protein
MTPQWPNMTHNSGFQTEKWAVIQLSWVYVRPVLILCWQTFEDENWFHVISRTCVAILHSPPLRPHIFTKQQTGCHVTVTQLLEHLRFVRVEFCVAMEILDKLLCDVHCNGRSSSEGCELLLGSCETLLVFMCSHFTSSPRLCFVLCIDCFILLMLQC